MKGKVIVHKIECHNLVDTKNGFVLCGIYQMENGIKKQWICEDCLNLK